MANDSKRKTDSGGTWVRWAQVVVTLLVGGVGVVFTFVTKNQMERSSVTLSALRLMGQRENSELALRQDVFKKITDSLLNKDTGLDTRIVLFELFQHNFHDVFNSRVLFDLLAKEAAGSLGAESRGESARTPRSWF